MPLFSKKNNIVFDFGTGIMKAVVFAPYQNPEILKFTKDYINSETLFKSNHLQNDVLGESIKKILKEFQVKDFSEFKNSYFLLSPEYIKEKILTVKIVRNNPNIKISKSEDEKIKKQASQAAQNKILEQIKSDEIQFLKFKILKINIDGYQVSKLNGLNGKEVELSLICVYSTDNYFKKAKSFIESLRAPNYKILFLSDFVLDLLKDTEKGNILIIDSGDKITRIYQGESGMLRQIFEVPLGGKKISKDLANQLNIQETEARAIKEKFFETGLSENLGGEIKNVLENAGKIFEIEINHNAEIDFSEFSQIFIFGGNNHFIKNFFAHQEIKDKIYKIEFKNIDAPKEILRENLYYNILLICNYAKQESI